MFTSLMTSRDPERSRSWSQYIWDWGPYHPDNRGWRYRLANGAPTENGYVGIKWSRYRWRHV